MSGTRLSASSENGVDQLSSLSQMAASLNAAGQLHSILEKAGANKVQPLQQMPVW